MDNTCENKVKEVRGEELQEMLGRGPGQPLLVDVRQPQEYGVGHIPGSLLIPLGQLEFSLGELDRERPVVVYCRSGKRSMLGATILCRAGFPRVSSLAGGILGWEYELLPGPPGPALAPGEVRSARDILRLALGKEEMIKLFYQQEGEKARDPELGALLQDLAAREKEHQETLYRRYRAWSEENRLPVEPLGRLLEGGPPGPGPGGGEGHTPQGSPGGRVELLERALQVEFEAYDFYKTSAEKMRDAGLRGLLLDLALEERAHASSLLKMFPG